MTDHETNKTETKTFHFAFNQQVVHQKADSKVFLSKEQSFMKIRKIVYFNEKIRKIVSFNEKKVTLLRFTSFSVEIY